MRFGGFGFDRQFGFSSIPEVLAAGPVELIANGDFASGVHGGTALGANAVIGSGQMVLTGTSIPGLYYWAIPTVIGLSYRIRGTIVARSNAGEFHAIRKCDEASPATNVVNIIANALGTGDQTIVATATTTFVVCQVNGFENITVDDISMMLA